MARETGAIQNWWTELDTLRVHRTAAHCCLAWQKRLVGTQSMVGSDIDLHASSGSNSYGIACGLVSRQASGQPGRHIWVHYVCAKFFNTSRCKSHLRENCLKVDHRSLMDSVVEMEKFSSRWHCWALESLESPLGGTLELCRCECINGPFFYALWNVAVYDALDDTAIAIKLKPHLKVN